MDQEEYKKMELWARNRVLLLAANSEKLRKDLNTAIHDLALIDRKQPSPQCLSRYYKSKYSRFL